MKPGIYTEKFTVMHYDFRKRVKQYHEQMKRDFGDQYEFLGAENYPSFGTMHDSWCVIRYRIKEYDNNKRNQNGGIDWSFIDNY